MLDYPTVVSHGGINETIFPTAAKENINAERKSIRNVIS